MKRESSLSFMLIGLGIIIFLGVLWFFVDRSNHVKKNIATATAIEFNKNYVGAVLYTSAGEIELQFLHKSAPKAIYNFVELAESNFYNKVKVHYVIKNFLLQSGDPLSRGTDTSLYGTGGPGYTLSEEISDVPLTRGVVAMANIGTETSGSQFFILTAEKAPALTGKFSVFAKVVRGFEILDQINTTVTENNVPLSPIVIDHIAIK